MKGGRGEEGGVEGGGGEEVDGYLLVCYASRLFFFLRVFVQYKITGVGGGWSFGLAQCAKMGKVTELWVLEEERLGGDCVACVGLGG